MFDQFKRNSKNFRNTKAYEITFMLGSDFRREKHIVNFRCLDSLAIYLDRVQNEKVKVVDITSLSDNAYIYPFKFYDNGFMALMVFNNN